VTAGLRRGAIAGRMTIERRDGTAPGYLGGASRARLDVTHSSWTLNRTAVGILLCGALGGLVLILVPWFPRLLQLLPFAVVLSLAAWFLVVARLRTSGPDEFLEALAARLAPEGLAEPPGERAE